MKTTIEIKYTIDEISIKEIENILKNEDTIHNDIDFQFTPSFKDIPYFEDEEDISKILSALTKILLKVLDRNFDLERDEVFYPIVGAYLKHHGKRS